MVRNGDKLVILCPPASVSVSLATQWVDDEPHLGPSMFIYIRKKTVFSEKKLSLITWEIITLKNKIFLIKDKIYRNQRFSKSKINNFIK